MFLLIWSDISGRDLGGIFSLNHNQWFLKMDEIDRSLIKLLSANSRQKYGELARIVGLTQTTVKNRIDRLESEGVIRRYSIDVDPRKLGFSAVAHVALSLEPLNFFNVLEGVSKISGIRSLSTCAGEHPIIFEVWKEDGAALAKFLRENVAVIPGILKISADIVTEQRSY